MKRAHDLGILRIVLILLALMIALPAFVMGAEISHAFGAWPALTVSLSGGCILGILAALTGAAGAARRCTTYELIGEAFGQHGARLANAVLGISVLGWYGVMATMLGHALAAMGPTLASQPVWLLSLSGCALTTATAMIGFRALNLLSLLTTPLKIGLLVWTFGASLQGGTAKLWTYVPTTSIPMGTGISMVVGGLIVGAVLAPDICRFAASPRSAAWGAGLAYGLGFPAVLFLSGLPSLVSGQRDTVSIMLALGLGIPAMLTVVLTAWSTNAFNLYAATLVAGTVAPRQPAWRMALLAGVVGTSMGLAGISAALMPYLLWLSILIPPVAGIYLVHVTFDAQTKPVKWRLEALITWLASSAWTGFAPRLGLIFTSVPALDSVLISAGMYFILRWARKVAVTPA